jgi:hypothetical protein
MRTQYIIIAMVVMMFALPIVSAEDLIYKQNSIIDVRIPCFTENNTYCSILTICNFTVDYPNGTNMFSLQAMTYIDGYASYIIPDSSINGIYPSSITCDDQGETYKARFPFYITPDGVATSQAKTTSFSVLTIIFLILTLGFLIFGIASKNLPVFVIGIMFGLTFFLFTLQLLMINPDLKASLAFYESIVTFYRIYIWLYYASILFLIVVVIFNIVQWNKLNDKEKMKKKYGEGIFDD